MSPFATHSWLYLRPFSRCLTATVHKHVSVVTLLVLSPRRQVIIFDCSRHAAGSFVSKYLVSTLRSMHGQAIKALTDPSRRGLQRHRLDHHHRCARTGGWPCEAGLVLAEAPPPGSKDDNVKCGIEAKDIRAREGSVVHIYRPAST